MSGAAFFGEGLPYCDISELKGKLIVIEGTDGVGRSSQVEELKTWLEFKGFGVHTTGLARSPLMGKAIERAKLGHNLNVLTYSLLYLADFADRLEHEVVPALRAGFIVLADRYMYTSIARAVVRGADRDWVRRCFSIALRPDLVIYLKIRVKELVPRVVSGWQARSGEGMDYWESGMDLGLGGDLYDSFVRYQKKILAEFDKMNEEFGFSEVDASRSFEETSERCKQLVLPVIENAG